jgi:predicted nucleic acid-binding Zn finger protein
MDTELTRRIIRNAWTESITFDPWQFRMRLDRAKKVRKTYKFELLAAGKTEEFYEVRGGNGPYHVFIDLTGKDSHYCTCPDGARRIEVAFVGGSLCKHVLAILLAPKKAQLLTVYLLLLAKAGPMQFLTRCGSWWQTFEPD